jgi:predicted ATPase/DNA-binding winged helix-turn-helix (wHTH) protein
MNSHASPTVVRFGACEVRFAERQLLVDGEPAKLGARAFDLLVAMIERRERTVSKNELLELVWPGLVVEENNLQVQISTLRKLLGQQTIATIPGRGYRFTAALAAAPTPTSTTERLRTSPLAPGSETRLKADDAPDRLPPLIGRDDDLAALRKLLEEHPLVTLTGTGGIGKTRLARAAVQALRDEAHADVCWVDLASVAECDKVVVAVAQALGVNLPPGRPPLHVLAQALAEQVLLLVLDNCEHVIDAVAALADALLRGPPRVRVLATSQEPIGVPLERTLRLRSLAWPSHEDANDVAKVAAYGATALLVERAQAADPRFALSAHNATAVVDICRQLDGIPLAIELAAARVKLLGMAGLRDRLGERFRILTAGSRLALRRHQTLHAALDWSHDLLTPDEQVVFRRLGVFAGGWTLEAAQDVASDEAAGEGVDRGIDRWAVLEHLGTLVDKSMVVAEGDDRPRYRLLETARAYALERLAQAGETEALAQRHARTMCSLLEQVYAGRFGEDGALDEAGYIALVRPEVDNLRAALAWATASAPPLAVALAAVATPALAMSGLVAEAIALLRRALPIADESVDDASAARLWCQAVMWGGDGSLPDEVLLRVTTLAERCCRRQQWSRALYHVLVGKAWRHVRLHEFDAARRAREEAAGIESPQWPGWLRADLLNLEVHWNSQVRKSADSAAVFERMAALLPTSGEETRHFRLRLNTAVGCNFRGEWQAAAAMLESLVDGARFRRGPSGSVGWAYGHLMLALVQLGRLDDARQRLRQALPYWQSEAILHAWLHSAIRLVIAQGRMADAMRLIGAEDAMPNQFGRLDTLSSGIRRESLRLIEAAEPDSARRAQWHREGEALDEDGIEALCLGEMSGVPAMTKSDAQDGI